MIEFEHVSQRFGATLALDDICLRAQRGRCTTLIGPSGCGKSTLLRLVAGLAIPSAGQVRVAGEPVCATTLPALRRRIGYVIQEGGLFPHLPVRGNVDMMARQLRWPAARIAERIEALCALTHFPSGLLDRHPGELSGGQRQRAGLMRALMLDPEVLLLDEPLGALDPMVRYEVQQELKGLFERLGKTVLLVTHDISEAAQLGDELVLLRSGRVVQQGTLRDFARAPADPFVTAFIAAQREPMEQVVEALRR